MLRLYEGVTAGEYCLLVADKQAFLDNAKIMYDALGTNCDSNPYITSPSSDFSCMVPGFLVMEHFRTEPFIGMDASVHSDGGACSIDVFDDSLGDSFCYDD